MTCTLKEWAPLSDLLNILPAKAQNGLFTYDICLTCIDVLPEYIALGTNFGLVYWYNRRKNDFQKLRCEKTGHGITVIKIISTVDYMIACGNTAGEIYIFQVPKSHPDTIPENLQPKNKQVERYTVSELHSAPISALEWSKNGMKLFSGDKDGRIVLTEIDFYMHLCKSVEILNESYEVVQLSYYQQRLLISTTCRSIICKQENKWKVTQVGKRDRKVLGNFGGIINQTSLRPNDALLYCIRPGLRIWVADVVGEVQKTLIFKDLLNQKSPEIQLINPVSKNLKKLLPQREAAFGVLLPFSDNLLVTYNNDVLYILNPIELTVNSTVSNLRSILCVAICKDEIFVLEGGRSLIRLSSHPEVNYVVEGKQALSASTSFLPLSTSIKDLTQKLHTSAIISAIPDNIKNEFNISTDAISVIAAEEASESPRKSDKDLKKLKVYDEISNQEFDDIILFKHKRHKKLDQSTAQLGLNCNGSPRIESSKSKPIPTSNIKILPDYRSIDSIKSDIETKEKMLADILHFDKFKIATVNQKSSTNPIKSRKNVIEKSKSTFISSSTNKTECKSDSEDIMIMPSSSRDITSTRNPDIPGCLDVPNHWQLQEVETMKESRNREPSTSDLSGEWVIV